MYTLSQVLSGEDQQQNEVLLSVVLSSGRQHDIRVSRDITVRKLKQICIPKHIQDKRLSGFEEATGGVPGAVASPAGVSDEDDESRFKLVHANSGRCLADAQSLSDQSIVHSGILTSVHLTDISFTNWLQLW